jgi:hypothetical protein
VVDDMPDYFARSLQLKGICFNNMRIDND